MAAVLAFRCTEARSRRAAMLAPARDADPIRHARMRHDVRLSNGDDLGSLVFENYDKFSPLESTTTPAIGVRRRP